MHLKRHHIIYKMIFLKARALWVSGRWSWGRERGDAPQEECETRSQGSQSGLKHPSPRAMAQKSALREGGGSPSWAKAEGAARRPWLGGERGGGGAETRDWIQSRRAGEEPSETVVGLTDRLREGRVSGNGWGLIFPLCGATILSVFCRRFWGDHREGA